MISAYKFIIILYYSLAPNKIDDRKYTLIMIYAEVFRVIYNRNNIHYEYFHLD